jgi:MinD superfamily P-loop ATPase
VAYKLELLPSLAGVHDMFHALQLKKCLKAPTNVIINNVAPLEADLCYPEHPMKLLGQQDRVMRRRTIRFYKVQ